MRDESKSRKIALGVFGFLITGALLSFNLLSVRMGDPTLPYLLSGIGYPGLMLVTAGLALRFLRAFEGQQIALEQPQSGLESARNMKIAERGIRM